MEIETFTANDTSAAANAGTAPTTVAQQIAHALVRHGTQYIIGQSVPAALTLAAVAAGITQILARTEKDAAIIADGYARTNNTVPVVTSCGGPGTMLLACGLGEALYASVPIVAFVQDTPSLYAERNAAQEFDDLALLKTVTKHACRVTRPDRVLDQIDRAFAIAASGRAGPVALLVAPDVLAAPAVAPLLRRDASYVRYPLDRVVPAADTLEAAAAAIQAARRPVVVAGGGVWRSNATEALAQFVELTQFPVATTTMGRGAVLDDHPLALGPLSYAVGKRARGKYTLPILTAADLVILVGTRTNQNGTHNWTLYPKDARYIHIDIDPQEIDRNYQALRLVGDARATLATLTAVLKNRAFSPQPYSAEVIAAIQSARQRHAAEITTAIQSNQTPIRPERVLAALDTLAPTGTTMVGDASYASTWLTNYVTAKENRNVFITPRGQAGIGWGFPLAIGAKLARPNDYTVYLGGDGAFAYTWAELETVVRHRMKKITVVLLNNSVFGYQKDAELVSLGAYTAALHTSPVNHAAIAAACGWRAARIEHPAEIEPALRRAFAETDPVLIEVISDPNAFPPLITFDQQLPDTVA